MENENAFAAPRKNIKENKEDIQYNLNPLPISIKEVQWKEEIFEAFEKAFSFHTVLCQFKILQK